MKKATLLLIAMFAVARAQLDMTNDKMDFEDNIAEESQSDEQIFTGTITAKPLLNGGKPFYVARDPTTGTLDFNMKKTVGIQNDIPVSRKDELSGNSKSGHDINSLGNNNFHDYLNLPVKYSSSKFVYPLISGSYANLKYQGNNKNQVSNHKNYTTTLGTTTESPKYFTHITKPLTDATFQHPDSTNKQTVKTTTRKPTTTQSTTTERTTERVQATTTPLSTQPSTVRYSSTIVQNSFPSTFKNKYVDSSETRKKTTMATTTTTVAESSTMPSNPVKFLDDLLESFEKKETKATTYRPHLDGTRLSFSTSMPLASAPSAFRPMQKEPPHNQSQKIVFEAAPKNPSIMSLSEIINSISGNENFSNEQNAIPYETANSSPVEVKQLPSSTYAPVSQTPSSVNRHKTLQQQLQNQQHGKPQFVDLPVHTPSNFAPPTSHVGFPNEQFEDYVEFENPEDQYASQFVKYEVEKPNVNLVKFQQAPSMNNVVISPGQNSASFVLGSQQNVGSVGVGSSLGVGTSHFADTVGPMKVGQVINDDPPIRSSSTPISNQIQASIRFPNDAEQTYNSAQIVKGTIKLDGSAESVQPPQALSQNKPNNQQQLVFPPSEQNIVMNAEVALGSPAPSAPNPSQIIFENVNDIYGKVNDKNLKQEFAVNEMSNSIPSGEQSPAQMLTPPSPVQQRPFNRHQSNGQQQYGQQQNVQQNGQQNGQQQNSQQQNVQQYGPQHNMQQQNNMHHNGPQFNSQQQQQQQQQIQKHYNNQRRPGPQRLNIPGLPNILPQFRPNAKASQGHPHMYKDIGAIRIPMQGQNPHNRQYASPVSLPKVGLPPMMPPHSQNPNYRRLPNQRPYETRMNGPNRSPPNPHYDGPSRNQQPPQFDQSIESGNRRVFRVPPPQMNDRVYMKPPPPPPMTPPGFQLKRPQNGAPETMQMQQRPTNIPQAPDSELNKSSPPPAIPQFEGLKPSESDENGSRLEPVITLQMLQNKKGSSSKLNLPPVPHDIPQDIQAPLPSNHKMEGSKNPSIYVVYPVSPNSYENSVALSGPNAAVVLPDHGESQTPTLSEYQNTPFSVVSHFEQEPLLMKKDNKKKQQQFPYHLERPAPSNDLKYDRPAYGPHHDGPVYNTGEQPTHPRVVNQRPPFLAEHHDAAISSKLTRITEKPIAIAYTPTEPTRHYSPVTNFYSNSHPHHQYSHHFDPHLSGDKFSVPNYGGPVISEIRDEEHVGYDYYHRQQQLQQHLNNGEDLDFYKEHYDFQAPFQASVSVNPEVTNPYEGWAIVKETTDTNKIDRSDVHLVVSSEETTTRKFDPNEFQPVFESGFLPIYTGSKVSTAPELIEDSSEYPSSLALTYSTQQPAATTSTTPLPTTSSAESSLEPKSSEESTTVVVEKKKKVEIDSLEAFFASLTRDYDEDETTDKSENENTSISL